MNEKIVVITGASQGLGKAVATKLIASGAIVALVAQDKDKLEKVATELGENAHAYECDISDTEQIAQTTKNILNDFGKIDILINNAGVWTDEELEKTNPGLRKEVFKVNTLGTIEFTKAFEPSLRKRNSGHVLNVISTSGDSSTSSGDNTLWQTYGASKWALAGFTRAFKDSLADTKIKVTGFYPGGFDSNLYENADRANPHDQPWMMQTNDVADALIFCLTQPADVLIEKLVVTKL